MIVFLNHVEFRKIMSALNDLTTALTDQTAALNELTTAIAGIPAGGAGGATEQQVADAATQVAANNTALRAQVALVPKAPAPAGS